MKIESKKPQRVQFHVTGPGELTAQQIQDACPDIEVMDPFFHIATLSGKADFDMELRIERGKGYVPAGEHVMKDFPLGMWPIDAVFTPILLVHYFVEPFRVGQKTDYERLVIDIKTDGTIAAEEAVHVASRILSEHVKLFYNEDFVSATDEDLMQSTIVPVEPKHLEKEKVRTVLLSKVNELEQLTIRTQNCFQQAGIVTVSDLVQRQESELLKLRNFGRKSLNEINAFLKNNNLSFGMNVVAYLKEDPAATQLNV